MKILYLACHSIIEYDDFKLFTELGHEVFSACGGSYMNPYQPADNKRPPILEGKYNQQLIDVSAQCSKDNLHQELIDWADVIMSHWMPHWIDSNWEKIKRKIVILRTNGQSTGDIELSLHQKVKEGLKIVRYSVKERAIPNYAGEDAVIYFYKDPEEYANWNGKTKQVISVNQAFKKRGSFLNYNTFVHCTSNFPRTIYGPNNEDIEFSGGVLSYDDLKKAYRENRAYFYVGTMPTCYTLNFIEAWMTGIPVVSIGPEHGNPDFLPSQKTFELQEFIKHGENGFVSDNEDELINSVHALLNDASLAKKISEAGRKSAIEIFGKEKIKAQWKEYFDRLQ